VTQGKDRPAREGEGREGEAHQDEARAFAEAMRGVKPLSAEERSRRAPLPAAADPARPRRRPGPPSPGAGEGSGADEIIGGNAKVTVEVTGDTIAGRAAGIDVRVLRRLKAGDFPVEGRLDLHGRPREQAAAALDRFAALAFDEGRRCLLVIHGRGAHSAADGPVLRPMVWRWLTRSPRAEAMVMAFASARPAQGGDGATLVLLRKPGR
jgi:DNA-nicking Smr family endonuclease